MQGHQRPIFCTHWTSASFSLHSSSLCLFSLASKEYLSEQLLGGHLLPALKKGFQKRPATTHSPWRWQLQCLSKRWIILNSRCSSSPEAEVARCNLSVTDYCFFLDFILFFIIRAKSLWGGKQRAGGGGTLTLMRPEPQVCVSACQHDYLFSVCIATTVS
jgi:hypothetical protein